MRRSAMLGTASLVVSLCTLLLAGLLGTPGAAAGVQRRAAERRDRPNVLLITADDMRADDLRFMPFTRGEFRRRAVTFADGLSPYPLCCPARAQIVTGQYNHNNGVRGNTWPNGGYWALRRPRNTLPVWLHRAGYLTAFVGKYMNEYDLDPRELRDPTGRLRGRRRYEVPAGWTHWQASVGAVYRYTHVLVNVDTPSTRPHRKRVQRYQTDYFSDVTTGLIRRYHRAGKPFFIWASHLAPHVARTPRGWSPPLPAERDRGAHRRTALPATASFRQALNVASRQSAGPLAGLPRLRVAQLLRLHRARADSLRSLDRAVRAAVTELKRTGEYADTTIIFTSDNGYMLGEHRYTGKDMPYEPALRVPMIVNGPGVKHRYRPGAPARARVTVPYTATITDVASTVTGVAGASPGRRLDGIDLTRPRQNPDARRGGDRVVLIESGARGPRRQTSERFAGVRTDRYTWFAWDLRPGRARPLLGNVEHYDRLRDPAQTSSLRPRAARGRVLRRLTLAMYDCRGRGCVRSLS